MKIFRSDAEQENNRSQQELLEQFEALERSAGELRQTIVSRRTLLKNAEKKLQEFQDTIYAMLIEEEYPKRKASATRSIDLNAPLPHENFSE